MCQVLVLAPLLILRPLYAVEFLCYQIHNWGNIVEVETREHMGKPNWVWDPPAFLLQTIQKWLKSQKRKPLSPSLIKGVSFPNKLWCCVRFSTRISSRTSCQRKVKEICRAQKNNIRKFHQEMTQSVCLALRRIVLYRQYGFCTIRRKCRTGSKRRRSWAIRDVSRCRGGRRRRSSPKILW